MTNYPPMVNRSIQNIFFAVRVADEYKYTFIYFIFQLLYRSVRFAKNRK